MIFKIFVGILIGCLIGYKEIIKIVDNNRGIKMITIIKSKNNKVQEVNITNRQIIDVGIAFIIGTSTITKAHASTSIAESFMPLVVVLQDLAEPVSYGFMIKGFLQIMAGNDHAGQKTIKSAIGGFIGIQFIPKIFEIIRSIKL